MKPKLLDSLIIPLITPLTISTTILLFLTFISTLKFNVLDVDLKDDSKTSSSSEVSREQQRLILVETNFKNYTMSKIEKNNQEIMKITEEINERERLIIEAKKRRINNLKKQNTKLNASMKSFHGTSNRWQSFKTNFSINFKKMGLPFSELFANNAKQ